MGKSYNLTESVAQASDWIELLKTNNLLQLGMLKEILEQAGVACFIRGENFSRLYGSPPILGDASLMVPRQDEDRAREILDPFLGQGSLFVIPETED